MAAARQAVALEMEAALADAGYWSGQLSMLEYRGQALDEVMGALTPFREMTAEEVKAAFAKYDVPDKRLQLVLVQKIDPEKLRSIVPPTPVGPQAPEEPRK
jgi:hypothetical protein